MAAKLKSHRKAQRKYRQSEKGKKAHREAENRRRHAKNQNKPKNMDDVTSTARRSRAMAFIVRVKTKILHMNNGPRCHFCGVGGRIVGAFPRRGYG